MDIRRQVGLNLKKLREKRGWSQEELSLDSGVHRTYVSGVERGIRNPTVTVLGRLAETLQTSPASFFDPVKESKTRK
jgi:transcriptional regulator with XRE-family HTH domain